MSILYPEKWVENYGDMLFRFGVMRVNDQELAKDLVQETFVAALRNLDNFKGGISEKNWLFTILKNKIIDNYRKVSTRLTDNFSTESGNIFFDENDHWKQNQHPQEWRTEENKNLETKEFYEVLENCKGNLKEMQNMVFSLKYLDNLESDEICKALDITPSNYWILMHRAKLQLRSCLEKNWFLK